MVRPATGRVVVARSFFKIPPPAVRLLSPKVRLTASTWVVDFLALTTTPRPGMHISLLTDPRTTTVSVDPWALATSPLQGMLCFCSIPGWAHYCIQDRWALLGTAPPVTVRSF